MNTPTLANSRQPTSGEVVKTAKPLVVKYTTHLRADMIKWVKREALERDMKDYEIVQLALDTFRSA